MAALPLKPVKGTLPPPARPVRLSVNAQWLAGEGAGSWFVVSPLPEAQELLLVERFDPSGRSECRGIFMTDPTSGAFDPVLPFTVTYPSHCALVKVLQRGQYFTLIPIPDHIALTR